jgi:hypothetical protein
MGLVEAFVQAMDPCGTLIRSAGGYDATAPARRRDRSPRPSPPCWAGESTSDALGTTEVCGGSGDQAKGGTVACSRWVLEGSAMWYVLVIILSVSIAALAIGISRRGASGG